MRRDFDYQLYRMDTLHCYWRFNDSLILPSTPEDFVESCYLAAINNGTYFNTVARIKKDLGL